VDAVGFIVFFVGMWLGAFASLARYDWLTMRRIHPVTLAGTAWLLGAWLVAAVTP